MALLALSPSSAQHSASLPGCALSAEDKAWVDSAVRAWRYTRANIVNVPAVANSSAIFFSTDCMISSTDALFGTETPVWTATPITDHVPLPDNNGYPIAVVARAQTIGNQTFFIMSTPSIWRAADVPGGSTFDLETLMTAVMLHEATHVGHGNTYLAQFPRLAAAANLPEDWNDDSIQDRFQSNAGFANSVARETDLLFAAANASSDAEARRLARQARSLMVARRTRFYRGNDADLAKIEDLFLTLEGAGQWVGFTWLVDRNGGNVSATDATAQFARRAGFWSQVQGLALALAIDRLDGGAWRTTAFGDGSMAGIELLDRALEQQPAQGQPR
jgi:hypothetical protein